MKLVVSLLLAAYGMLAQTPLVEGNAKSAVRVLIFEDLQCPDCAAFRRMMDQSLLARYAGKVAFEHRDFPLPKHKWALPAAKVARGLERIKPELGLEYRRYMMNRIPQVTAETFIMHVDAFASEKKLEPAKLRAMMDDPELMKVVEADTQDGVARGVSKTPTVFVNGQPFIETFSLEEISKGIDTALIEANQ